MAESAAPAGGRVVHPDGSITYDFDGHISAEGLDLPAAPGPVSTPETVPTVSGLSWVAAGGGLAARLWADTRGLDLYADGSIMARTAGADRMVLDNAGNSDFAQLADISDVVRGDPGLHISPQTAVNFSLGGGGFTTIDIDFGVPLTGHEYLPLTAIINGGAADRCNHPAYEEIGPTTLRFTVSTDYGFAVTGALVVHLLYYA
jgi:hypothetical protein